eukprot:2920359-Rhodomonas_salina.3
MHTFAAAAVEYVPAAHKLHASDPATALNAPGAHAEQAVPSGPSYPTLQTQSVMSLLAAGACVLLGQATHAADPVTLLNEPAAHAVQHSNLLATLRAAFSGQGSRKLMETSRR